MSGSSPMFSIVVPTLDAAAYLPHALTSMVDQDFRDFEVLIVDGGSADGTVEIATGYESRLPRLLLLMGRQRGVYAAINEGIAAASGRWVLVLGSDDRLRERVTLSRAAERLRRVGSAIAYGDVMVRGTSDRMSDGERYAGRFDLAELTKRNVCQQAIFYRRDLFDRVGGFDARFRTCADWAFLLQNFVSESPEWIDLVVADYHAGGLSSRVVDHAFVQSRPMILLRAMLSRPLSVEVQKARWHLRRYAIDCRTSGLLGRSALLTAGWAALALLSRVSGPHISQSHK